MLTSRFDAALRYAHDLHREQTRKGTPIPYFSHLMTVSALVIEHGGDEDQAIGALLHDAAEDQGGAATLAEIQRRFGDAVAEIVADCTDAWTELRRLTGSPVGVCLVVTTLASLARSQRLPQGRAADCGLRRTGSARSPRR